MFKCFSIFALLCVSVVSAKTYSFAVSLTVQAGYTQLKPGDYSLKVDGTQVVLKDNAGNQIDIVATLETADRKFDETAVFISKADGRNRIQWIQIGGSNTKVVFECPIERCNVEGSCHASAVSCSALAGS